MKAAPYFEMWEINTWGQPSAFREWELLNKWLNLQFSGFIMLSMLHADSQQVLSVFELQLPTAGTNEPFITFLFYLILLPPSLVIFGHLPTEVSVRKTLSQCLLLGKA